MIRRALWRGRTPPSPDRRPWSMARELHAWQRLVDAGTDPRELNAALGALRSVYPAARRVTCLVSVPGLLADVLQTVRVRESQERRRGTVPAAVSLAELIGRCTAVGGNMSPGRSSAPPSPGQLGLPL